MSKYEALITQPITTKTTLAHPVEQVEIAHLEDPAITVMTDFTHTEPVTISGEQSIVEAQQEMDICNIHLLLVVNEGKELVGIISSKILHGELPIKIAQEKRIPHAQIKVKMLLCPLDEIDAVDYALLEHNKVGNIINTMKRLEKSHLLVIKHTDEGSSKIVGLFSASHIGKKTQLNITDFLTAAHSIAELQQRDIK